MHVAVATYQESRGNEVGRTRQLEKAIRRLTPYAPSYEGIQIASLLDWCRAVAGRRALPARSLRLS